MNKREIDHAFSKRPNSLIIYVFGQQNGRLRDEDVVAFNSINAAYPLNVKSLLLVVNGLPSARPDNYEGEVMLMLQDIIQLEIAADRVCFLNYIEKNDPSEREGLKNQLLKSIVELTPTEHIKIHDIHLKADEVSLLKQQIETMTRTFDENKAFFQEEIREHQQKYDQFVADQKVEADHFRRIIERQTEDAKEMRQNQEAQNQRMQDVYASQLSAMKEHMTSMQDDHRRLTKELRNKSDEEAKAVRSALDASNDEQKKLREKISELQTRRPEVVEKKSSVSE